MRKLSKTEGIKVKGHGGTFYIIESAIYGKPWDPMNEWSKAHLLESEQWGDMANCLIVDDYGRVLCEDVWNGWSDLEYELDVEVKSMEELGQ